MSRNLNNAPIPIVAEISRINQHTITNNEKLEKKNKQGFNEVPLGLLLPIKAERVVHYERKKRSLQYLGVSQDYIVYHVPYHGIPSSHKPLRIRFFLILLEQQELQFPKIHQGGIIQDIINIYIFLCKHMGLEDSYQLLQFLGSL